jgi:hypothetical protein
VGAIHVAPAELVCGTPPATGQLPGVTRLEELFSRIGYRRDATFDLVYANFVVEHLARPYRAFAEWHRVLDTCCIGSRHGSL